MSDNKMVIMGVVIFCVMEKMKIFLVMINMINRFFYLYVQIIYIFYIK